MCEMTKHFLEIHAAKVPSEKFNHSLSYYLQGVHDTIIREAGEGSLRIVVECRTLEILERLWDDYNSGHLNEVAEERLLTDEIKKKYEVESIELETTITMEDYLACKLSLTDLNRDSTVAENLTDRANGQPLVVQDEEQRELSTVHFTLNYNDFSASPNELHTNQVKGSLRLVSEMLSEEKTSQSSFMELPTYLRHVTVTQDSEPTKERDNSLRFSVECRDLESLECLWSDYRSGRLDWIAKKFLLTDDIKKRFHVESVTLETSILEEDYLACKEHLLKNSQNSGKSLMGDGDDTEILLTEGAIQTANTDDLGIQTSIEGNTSNSLMGDRDDTEILPTQRAIQTANTDNLGTQTSKEAISQLVDQSKTVVRVEDKNETTEEQQIIAGKMIENTSNSLMGDGDDTEILPTQRAIQTANTDDRSTHTSKEAISQLVDQSKTVIPVKDKNETTEEQQIIAGKMIGLEAGTSDSHSDDKDEVKTSTNQQGPEPFQSIPAQELLKDSCSKCGWIRKEEGSIKSWCDRYIILHKGCMYYYNTPDAKTTAGKFSLSGYRLSPAPEKTSKFQWTFKLIHLQPEKRTYYFAAYSEQEMNEWMNSIVSDMREYCGTGRQSIIKPGDNAELEYCYPEVEPKFDMEQFAAMFENPQLKPALEIMYGLLPEMGSPQVPTQRPVFPLTKLLRGGFTNTDILTPVPGQGGALFGAVRKSREGRSLGFPRKLSDPPAATSRKGKPPVPPKPPPRPPPSRPPRSPLSLMRHTTEPIMRYRSSPRGDQEKEEGKGYLDIVPDTNTKDFSYKQPTLLRSVQ